MRRSGKAIKVFLGSLVFLTALALTESIRLTALSWAQTTQTITLISGNGPVGGRDPLNQFTLDGGATFEDAYIIPAIPGVYALIPGTQYITWDPNWPLGPEFTTTRYRTTFVLPCGFSNPSLTIDIHADNVATIFLNGTQIGQQPFGEIGSNFHDPPESFMTTDSSLFQEGTNFLEFDITDFHRPTAFDYKALISFTSTSQVDIDIKPGSDPNSINPRSKGKVPVAVLTDRCFDATTVDPSTVLFGATGTEASPVHSALEDVDGDGDSDMILHFNTQATGIECGDTSASLTGETFGEQMIQGSDSVNTVGCQ